MLLRKPMNGFAGCARAARGPLTVAPPIADMACRLPMSMAIQPVPVGLMPLQYRNDIIPRSGGNDLRGDGQEFIPRHRLFPPADPAGGGDRPADFDLSCPSGTRARTHKSCSVSAARWMSASRLERPNCCVAAKALQCHSRSLSDMSKNFQA